MFRSSLKNEPRLMSTTETRSGASSVINFTCLSTSSGRDTQDTAALSECLYNRDKVGSQLSHLLHMSLHILWQRHTRYSSIIRMSITETRSGASSVINFTCLSKSSGRDKQDRMRE
ncbi:hypothetical protein PoB_005177800 [Plakobranchus ocellatus]|uniref:Uncharacterized protein n=1 Tax=Plakobranchus ocellatus TaxID=259542 RepID=A0AAV4C2Q0_9GAST|nr:hypothetical protein PoB_005177800 [Plakobranchus ocellatus]